MKLFITQRAQKELDKIPPKIAEKIIEEIYQLPATFPNLKTKKLKGSDNYRLKIGAFRVIFSLNKRQHEMLITRIADRKTVYR